MLITRVRKFLTTPAPRTSSPQVVFWFSLSLTFAAIYGILGLKSVFSNQYAVSGDGRQHVFWMRRFLDPELFPNDLIADYFQSVAPPGYSTLYHLMARLGLDPLFFSKLLPMVLVLVTTGYCFGVSMQMLPVPAAGFFATLMLNQSIWIDGSLPSGTARAFLYPLFLAFLYYLLRQSLLPCVVAIALQGLFYPPWVFIIAGVLILRVAHWEHGRFSISRNRNDYWFSAAGLGVALLVLLPYALETSKFGPTITVAQARALSEFLAEGRTRFFVNDPLEFWFCGERSGILPWKWCYLPLKPPQLLFGLLLAICLRYPSRFPLSRQISSKVTLLFQVVLVSIGMFFAAHAVLFKLYLPGRYPQHNLQIVMPIAAGIALTIILDAILNWAQQKGQIKLTELGLFLGSSVFLVYLYLPIQYSKKSLIVLIFLVITIALTRILNRVSHWVKQRSLPDFSWRQFLPLALTALLGAVMILYPNFLKLSYVDFPYNGYKTGRVTELYKFFEQQPKDILIASLAEEANNLPTFAKRSILVGWKYSVPYSTGYYAQISQRAIDLINAQYSPDLEQVKSFMQKYGVDFWLLDRKAFTPEYITNPGSQTSQWMIQYQPATTEALQRLKQGTVPTLAKVMERCSVFETESLVVLQAACIR